MIRTVRALFLARLLREKILLVALVLVAAVLWMTNLGGRVGLFLREQRHTQTTLAEQNRWLKKQGEVEKAAKQTSAAFTKERMLNDLGLLTAIQNAVADSGLQRTNISPAPDETSSQLAIHTCTFTVNRVDWQALERFFADLDKNPAYIRVKLFNALSPDKSSDALNVSMQISSVEILHEGT
jgi:hypothetical protein